MPVVFDINQIDEIVSLLKEGKIGIMPTDTIYGIHCLANDSTLFDRVYQAKERPGDMPFIKLIASALELDSFGVTVNDFVHSIMRKHWPGPNTLVFEIEEGRTEAFRLPENGFLQAVVSQTGPIISTSANKHGFPVVKDITEAQEVFGDDVDFFVDGGKLSNPASSIFKILDGFLERIR